MRLSLHSAARGVTGCCHLLERAGREILIDFGLYQGGRIPLPVARGLRGEIGTTAASRELVRNRQTRAANRTRAAQLRGRVTGRSL